MKSVPRISIVSPSFNQGRFLRESIKSILKQSYPNMEYFIVDGGSTDNSVDIIREYENYIDWWVSGKDMGQSDAINKGFSRATGDLFCWVNSDDVLLPDALKTVAKVFAENPEIDIITGNVVYINADGIITRFVKLPKMKWSLFRWGLFYFSAPAVFFKKELYERVGGLNVSLHLSMDVDLWHRFRLENATIYHIKEYLGGFRIHSSSKTIKIREGKKIFENPETTILREKYIPDVANTTIMIFRMFYKLWQVANLNYLRGWYDYQRWKGKTWQEIFGKV